MACYKPLKAYATLDGGVVFYEHQRHDTTKTIWLACGQCIGCKIERARQWAVRIMHESQLHERNSFLTLTYSDENLPEKNSLRYEHYQSFMRRIRKKFKHPIRFYMCGEYGSITGRPHYHACIFGENFIEDRYIWKKTESGHQLYRSPTLEKLWKLGDSNIGELTFDSANYVAGYIQKKLTGDGEKDYYDIFDPETGEIHTRRKEFAQMSLKPGIGKHWLQLYWPEITEGKVIVNGKEATAPKYYRKYFRAKEEYGLMLEKMAENIKPEDQTDERLATREKVALARTKLFERNKQ